MYMPNQWKILWMQPKPSEFIAQAPEATVERNAQILSRMTMAMNAFEESVQRKILMWQLPSSPVSCFLFGKFPSYRCPDVQAVVSDMASHQQYTGPYWQAMSMSKTGGKVQDSD